MALSHVLLRCVLCAAGMVEAKLTRKLFQEGEAAERMVAVVMHKPGTTGKRYRGATDSDFAVFRESEAYLAEKREQLTLDWGMNAVPDEPLPPKGTLGFRVQGYGILKWGDCFNTRQKLALITFAEKVKGVYQQMVTNGVDKEYAKAVVSYLALTFDRMAMSYNSLTSWQSGSEKMGNMFPRQTLSMVWIMPNQIPLEVG